MAVKMIHDRCLNEYNRSNWPNCWQLNTFSRSEIISYKKKQTHKIFVPSLTSTLFLPYDLILSIFLKSCACKLPNLHLTIIFPLIHPPHPSSPCFFLLPHHSIRLLNSILTPVINNRLVIPLSINIPPTLSLRGFAISQSS